MELEFGSLEELYERMKPALTTKQAEMKRAGYPYIQVDDIWNYLKEIKWRQARNLSLSEMVSDVLDSDNLAIDQYLKEKYQLKNRKLYFEE